jgi:hypothetical protein
MQKVMPVGPDYTELGRTDNNYSTWIFSYTNKYHLISEGTNELTAKLSCDIYHSCRKGNYQHVTY